MTATIIDFHLVEKCRTKFRAFVKSHGARVKFDPVEGTPRKQEYHGTVTVTRACKQQFLTQHPQVLRPGKTVCPPGEHPPDQVDRVILQCAAPTPITTGAPRPACRCVPRRTSAPGQHVPVCQCRCACLSV